MISPPAPRGSPGRLRLLTLSFLSFHFLVLTCLLRKTIYMRSAYWPFPCNLVLAGTSLIDRVRRERPRLSSLGSPRTLLHFGSWYTPRLCPSGPILGLRRLIRASSGVLEKRGLVWRDWRNKLTLTPDKPVLRCYHLPGIRATMTRRAVHWCGYKTIGPSGNAAISHIEPLGNARHQGMLGQLWGDSGAPTSTKDYSRL